MLLPKEELEKLGVLNPEIAEVSLPTSTKRSLVPNKSQYLKEHPRPKMELSEATMMRKGMEVMEKLANGDLVPLPKEEEFYHEIPMRDGFSSALKILKPAAGGSPGPLIVLCFVRLLSTTPI